MANLHKQRIILQGVQIFRNQVRQLLYSGKHVHNPGSEIVPEEVRIPTLNGWIAGKLWKSKNSTLNSTPVICTHGFLDNAATFDALLPLIIKPGMTFLSIDLPGHGFSSPWPGTLYDHHVIGVISLLKILRYYNWSKISLMGHSLGAQISYIFAAAFPEMTDRFIAIENFHPVPITDWPLWFRNVAIKQDIWETKYSTGKSPPSYSHDEIVRKLYLGRDKSITLEGCKILLTRGAIKQEDGKFIFSYDIGSSLMEQRGRFTREEAKLLGTGITSPICLIKADPGNDYQPREEFMDVIQFMKTINKNMEFHLVSGTHSVHLNEPNLLAPIISKFLNAKF